MFKSAVFRVLVLTAALSIAKFAEARGAWIAGQPNVGSQNFGGAPGGGRWKGKHHPGKGKHGPHELTPAQEEAFKACMQQNRMTPPERPQLSAEQHAAMESCKQQSTDRESFHQCMQAAGISPPPRPNFNSAQMQTVHTCRSQALGQS